MGKPHKLPVHYRNRAEELRAIAEITVDPRYRDILVKCAEDYDRLANQADIVHAMFTDVRREKLN